MVDEVSDVRTERAPTKPVPIRLDDDLRLRLREAAKRMGTTSSGVIRFAITNQLPEIESGRITLADVG